MIQLARCSRKTIQGQGSRAGITGEVEALRAVLRLWSGTRNRPNGTVWWTQRGELPPFRPTQPAVKDASANFSSRETSSLTRWNNTKRVTLCWREAWETRQKDISRYNFYILIDIDSNWQFEWAKKTRNYHAGFKHFCLTLNTTFHWSLINTPTSTQQWKTHRYCK